MCLFFNVEIRNLRFRNQISFVFCFFVFKRLLKLEGKKLKNNLRYVRRQFLSNINGRGILIRRFCCFFFMFNLGKIFKCYNQFLVLQLIVRLVVVLFSRLVYSFFLNFLGDFSFKFFFCYWFYLLLIFNCFMCLDLLFFM